MELSEVVSNMQTFINRLEGLDEEGRSHILKIKNTYIISINDHDGKEKIDMSWSGNNITDNFIITDKFMIQRTNEGVSNLFIKFTREQTQDFTIKNRDPIMKEVRLLNNLFRKEEVLDYYTDVIEYPVTYTQEYWIHADDIDIVTTYKGKCS